MLAEEGWAAVVPKLEWWNASSWRNTSFLHNTMRTNVSAYSVPFSLGEAMFRINENGAAYIRNYTVLLLTCAVGVFYKRAFAVLGLLGAAGVGLAAKRIAPFVRKTKISTTLLENAVVIVVATILIVSGALGALVYATAIGSTICVVHAVMRTPPSVVTSALANRLQPVSPQPIRLR